jgi:hypothetical protein
MDWANEGRKGIGFVAFVIIAIPISLFLGGVFATLVPSTSIYYPAIQNLESGVNSAIALIINPVVLLPLAAVVAFIGIAILHYMSQNTGGGSGSSGGYRA